MAGCVGEWSRSGGPAQRWEEATRSVAGRRNTELWSGKVTAKDLDETLVHARASKPGSDYHLRLEIVGLNTKRSLDVYKRPFVDVFLETMSRYFKLAIFTSSIRRYADPVIDFIDPNCVTKQRLFRESCRRQNDVFVKDLSLISGDLSKVVIVDNSPESYRMNPHNGIHIKSWYGDKSDEELLNMIPFLVALTCLDDVRTLLCRSKAIPPEPSQLPGTLSTKKTEEQHQLRKRHSFVSDSAQASKLSPIPRRIQ